MTPSRSLSVVLPAFNEAGSLEAVVRRVDRELASISPSGEIVVVNDGSSDGTGGLADALQRELPRVRALHHAVNGGYGAAQRTGLRAARCELVCVLPADGQVAPEELRHYLTAADQADVIVGRYRERPDAPARRFLSRAYVAVLRLLYGVRLQNVNAPKMYRREQLAGVEITARGGFGDAEIVLQLHGQGRTFHEIDVDCLPRVAGRSSVGAAAAFEAMRELWAFHRAARLRAASVAGERRTRA
jgi:glycosyltransferase involved in cell wall biosynthesis